MAAFDFLVLSGIMLEMMSNKNIADEIWCRDYEKELIEKKLIHATIRAGDRGEGTADPKGAYMPGSIVRLRIQNPDGSFDPYEAKIIIISAEAKKLKDIKAEEMIDNPPECRSRDECRRILKLFYERDFSDSDLVTIIKFDYEDQNGH